jgi:hypothetical protein
LKVARLTVALTLVPMPTAEWAVLAGVKEARTPAHNLRCVKKHRRTIEHTSPKAA